MMAVLHTKVDSDRTISLKNPLSDVLLPKLLLDNYPLLVKFVLVNILRKYWGNFT